MLSIDSRPLQQADRRQQSFETRSVILRTSSELAKCESDEIEKISQQAIVDLMQIEGAEQAGWFSLGESGSLREVLSSTCEFPSARFTFGGGLDELPWCLALLCAGKAVLIESLTDLPAAAGIDQQSLKACGVRSLALIPSNSLSLGRTLMVLLSTSTEIDWSDGILEHYTLLENILSSSYQRKLADEESKATTKRFHQLFLSSTTPMATLAHSGQFILTNVAFRDLLGYSEGQLRQMKCDDVINLADQCDKTSLLKDLSGQMIAKHRLCERNLVRKDLSLMPARIKVHLMERHAPEESRALMSIEDLTEHHVKEDELCRRQVEIDLLASQLIQSQENERKHLSRELHDDIGQRLSLAASEVALMASQHSDTTPISVSRLEVLRDELDGLCSDVHEMSHNLHSYKLQHLGLKAALKDLSRRICQPNFHVDLRADEFEDPASEDVALCLYRVAQESLNNALKHAHALEVAVTLTKLQSTFYMTIQDSGVGFDSSVSSQGLGLLSMHERVKLVSGQFRLHSVPGRGTEIWVEIPDGSMSIGLPKRSTIHAR